jgi:hypothetical protein
MEEALLNVDLFGFSHMAVLNRWPWEVFVWEKLNPRQCGSCRMASRTFRALSISEQRMSRGRENFSYINREQMPVARLRFQASPTILIS